MRDLFPDNLLPEYFAALPINAEKRKLLRFGWLFAPTAAASSSTTATGRSSALALRRRRIGSGRRILAGGFDARCLFLAARNGRLHKNLITPNDRRGRAVARDSDFPFNIGRFAPGDRWIRAWGRPVLKRPSPLRPIIFCAAPCRALWDEDQRQGS